MNDNPLSLLVAKIDLSNLWDKQISFDRNEFLTVKGSMDSPIFLVEEGTVRVFIIDENEEHTIRFGYKGNLITALDSFITGKPTEVYIQALKKTITKQISKKKFIEFISSSVENSKLWQELLQLLVYQQMERERDILTQSPQDRLNRVLKRSPQLFQEIPHKYIASYLRMTPETLSRMKKS